MRSTNIEMQANKREQNMRTQAITLQSIGLSFKSFFSLCKPRVTSLIVFTAIIGMYMAKPATAWMPWQLLLATTLGIAFASGAAAAFNCLIEHKIDAIMARTRARALPTGQVSSVQTMTFATILGGTGLAILYFYREPAHHVADLSNLCGLCGDLYGVSKTCHANEYCDWRRFRRDATNIGLGSRQ